MESITTHIKKENKIRKVLWAAVIVLIITMFISSTLRTNEIVKTLSTGIFPNSASIDYGYSKKPLLTLLHILPGMLFLLLGAFQFIKPIRQRYPFFHRTSGKIYIVLGLIIGITAIIMSIFIRFGGYIEMTAVVTFGFYFLYSLITAYKFIRKKNFAQHREWMIRAFSIGLAIATMRPIIGSFLAFTSIPFHLFFGYVFWIAFILHFIVAEKWIAFTRNK